jgi:hypothetical protein
MAWQMLIRLLAGGATRGAATTAARGAASTAARGAASSAGRGAATTAGRGAAAGGAGGGGGGQLAGKLGEFTETIVNLINPFKQLVSAIEFAGKAYLYGVDNIIRLKGAQAVTEYFEDTDLLKTFGISLGSEFNVPWGTTKYWDETLREINKANKELGIAGSFSEEIRDNILRAGNLSTDLGFGQKELTETYKTFTENYGRNIMLSGDELTDMTKISNTLGKNYNELFGLTKLYGASIEDTFDFLDNTNKEVDKLGLNTKKVFDEIESNIRLIDKFNFKNGVAGLSEMVKKAGALGMKMESISNFADKVYDPEQAIEAAASLQMLGGEFAKLGDPFSLLYDANNDLEAFTEKLAEVTKGMGALNKQTGMIDLSPLEMRQLRAFSTITGQSVEELAQQAKLAKKEDIIEKTLSPNLREYATKIAGMASFQQGIATIKVDGQTKAVRDLTEQEILRLSTITLEEGKSTFDTLATANQTAVEHLEHFAKKVIQMSNNFDTLAIETAAFKDGVKAFNDMLKDPNSYMRSGIDQANQGKQGAALSAQQVAKDKMEGTSFFDELATGFKIGSPFSYLVSRYITGTVSESKPKNNDTSFKPQDNTLKSANAVQQQTGGNYTTTNTTNGQIQVSSTGAPFVIDVNVNGKPSTKVDLSKDNKFKQDIENLFKGTNSNGGRNTGPF